MWYGVAAERGLAAGRCAVARMHEQRGALAVACREYLAAAEAGDGDAAWALSRLHDSGAACVADAAAAERWLESAAQRNHPEALARVDRGGGGGGPEASDSAELASPAGQGSGAGPLPVVRYVWL